MKKIIMILVTMSMILSLVACGNSKETGGSETDIENNSTVANESTEKVSEQESENNATDTSNSKEDVENSNSSLELTVEADYENLPESQGFEFESNGDGICTLKKIGSCSDKDIVIPEKSPAGDTVTMIAEYAFYGAEDINSIVIAGKTMELDQKAFQSCEVEKIVITGCDLTVGENAFSYCDDVSEVYISNSKLDMEAYAFYDTGKDMGVKIINCTGVLDDKAFQSCGVGELIINGCTLELGENIFSYCEDLVTITMDSSTLEIGKYAFYDSGDDTIVTFTNCGLNIDDKAFQSCGLITYSFYDCTSLVNVSIAADSEDDNLELFIDDEAFQSCSVQNVVIGRGKVEIGDSAFSYCEDLVSVEIKGTLSDIGDYAFYDCPAELVISYNGGSYNKESIEDAK